MTASLGRCCGVINESAWHRPGEMRIIDLLHREWEDRTTALTPRPSRFHSCATTSTIRPETVNIMATRVTWQVWLPRLCTAPWLRVCLYECKSRISRLRDSPERRSVAWPQYSVPQQDLLDLYENMRGNGISVSERHTVKSTP